MMKLIFTIYFCLVASQVFALNYKKVINNSKANKKFSEEKYEKAEELHKENSIEYPNESRIHFNLGDAYYKNKKYDEAIFEFQKSLKNNELDKSDVFYNIGNAHFQKQDYKKALENYKNSLLDNSTNKKAKYNYELTKQFLQKQKQQKKDQQNQDKDTKEKEKKQKKKEQKQQSKKGEQEKQKQKNENEKQQKASQEKIKKAERILDAMQRIENENQKKMMKKILKTGKVKQVEKNW